MNDTTLPPAAGAAADVIPAPTPEPTPAPAVDPVRAAAGRLGAQRLLKLAELGREYEREHGLTPGRQRRRQLIQLGKRYEYEHGLRTPKARRRARGDAWSEFVAALARVVKPAHRPAVEKLAAALRAA
ncbi:MAG: hypothetical protein C0501_11920 [Isosphaera sp.]|nr:hypothetical protein [Isosphaera sp.]